MYQVCVINSNREYTVTMFELFLSTSTYLLPSRFLIWYILYVRRIDFLWTWELFLQFWFHGVKQTKQHQGAIDAINMQWCVGKISSKKKKMTMTAINWQVKQKSLNWECYKLAIIELNQSVSMRILLELWGLLNKSKFFLHAEHFWILYFYKVDKIKRYSSRKMSKNIIEDICSCLEILFFKKCHWKWKQPWQASVV